MEQDRSKTTPFSAWAEEVEAYCRDEYGLPLSAFDRLRLEEAFEAGIHPASAFEELVVAGLIHGIHAARFRLLGVREPGETPLTAADFSAVTEVRSTVASTDTKENRMTDWINFRELRSQVSLEDVILRFYGITTLKRDGDKLIGPCPVHGGDSPRAFHADLTKNVWHCFSKCASGGNQLDFVAKKENLSIRDAALKLREFFGGQKPAGSSTTTRTGGKVAGAARTTVPATAPPVTARTPAASFPAIRTPGIAPTAGTPMTSVVNPPAVAPTPVESAADDESETNRPLTFKLDLKHDHPHLLSDRKLKKETCERFGVGYCSRGILRGMIAIPIHDEDGDIVAYAGRRLKPADIREFGKYKLPKGFRKERVLYNLHTAKATMAESGLILVEGFFTVLALYEAGFQNVVATMGCELSTYQAQLLSGAKDLVVLYDGDEAGRAGADAVKAKLNGLLLVRVIRLPTGVKPDQLDPRMLRWLVNGIRQLDLGEVSYLPAVLSPAATLSHQ